METKLKKITEFVLKHTDEQCGLNVANVQIYDSFGLLRIIVSHKKSIRITNLTTSKIMGMRNEWKYQGLDLIDELGKDPVFGYGAGIGINFELQSAGTHHFEIRETG